MQKVSENTHMYSYFLECENIKQYSSDRFLHPHFFLTTDQTCSIPAAGLYFLISPSVAFPATSKKLNALIIKIGATKRRTLQLIYFFESFCKYRILHNYAMPQVMPHAIPQTHAAFYPHRS